ncbi:MAG: PEP-CTERM sorting domain-containing protein [Fimbriimonadaceae bacterium]
MNKSIAILLVGASLTSIATAQSVTGSFNFSNAPVAPVDTFSSNGFALTVSGLSSATSLDQSLSSVLLNASSTNILVGAEHGLGAGPYSDHELRNGAGTPALKGATLLELSDLDTPNNTMANSLTLDFSSVDHSTHEGFLVYGSTQDASKGLAKLILLDHGTGNSNNAGSFTIGSSLLSKYSSFYVTADNSYYSSVLLGPSSCFKASPTPEPITIAGLALSSLTLLRRRKKA